MFEPNKLRQLLETCSKMLQKSFYWNPNRIIRIEKLFVEIVEKYFNFY